MKWVAAFLLFLVASYYAIGQTPVANFTMPAETCLNEALNITNTSTNATTYIWDFCHNDLNTGTPGAILAASFSGASLPMAITVAFDAGNWYGFLSSRGNNKIYRINFGNSLDNTPAAGDIYDLGNVGGVLSGPKTLRFVLEGSVWYAIGINNAGSTLFRLVFGSGLESAPTATQLIGNLDSWSSPEGLDVVFDGTDWIAMVSSYDNNKVSLVKIGPSITNTPTSANALTIMNGAADITTPFGSKLYKDGTNWYGLVTSYNVSKVYRLNFGPNLFSIPTKDDVFTASGPTTNISIQKEGEDYHAYLATKFGSLFHLNFGSSLSNSVQSNSNLGNFGVLSRIEGFDLVRSSPGWYAFAIDYSSNNLYKFKFSQGSCSTVSANQSTQASPDTIRYTLSGNYVVDLTAISATGVMSNKKQTITITNLSAPSIDFSSGDNNCIGQSNTFTSIPNDASISSFDWNFDDGNSATGGSTAHQFVSTGDYLVRLNVIAANGCIAKVNKTVSIYNAPTAAFSLPTNNPLCTNQLFSFNNTSSSDIGSTPSWNWFVNGTPVSTDQNLQYAFSDITPQTIKLKASIPGCYTEATEVMNSILSGPNVDFTAPSTGCANDEIIFTNATTDPVTQYIWNFGDSQTSNDQDVSHSYSVLGEKTISLQGNSSNGCQNVTSKIVTIYSKPQTNFSLALPPFSCSGTDSQFNDLTPNPADSNLESWLWTFDDPESTNNTSTAKHAKHTYADAKDYNVSLKVTTDFNCSTTLQKVVTISQSPNADFTNDPVCKNQPVEFKPTVIDPLSSYKWQIGNTFPSQVKPIHTFTLLGLVTVNLTVTSTNNCEVTSTKDVVIHSPLTPAFSVEKNCENQNTIFTSTTITDDDPVIEYNWKFPEEKTGSPATNSFKNTGDYNVILKVTAESGCSYSITKKISIVEAPTASFSATPDAGIPPLDVKFTNTSSNVNDDGSAFLWTFNDNVSSTSSEISPNYIFQELGKYIVDLKAINALGCFGTFSQVIAVVIPFNDISISNFTVTENLDGTLKGLAILRNNGNLIVKDINLSLDLSGNTKIRENIAGPILPQASYSHTIGFEIFKSKDLNYLCAEVEMEKDSIADNNRLCTGFSDESYYYDTYPNPTIDELHIEWIAKDNTEIQVVLFDNMGKSVLSTSLSSVKGYNQHLLLIHQLNSGVYILKIKSGSMQKLQRVSITNN